MAHLSSTAQPYRPRRDRLRTRGDRSRGQALVEFVLVLPPLLLVLLGIIQFGLVFADWIQVTNATGKTLTILGYAHEPYLRITPAGVEQNATSPTVTLNQSLFADISQALTRQAAPQWLPMSPGNQARWHDHRIHWMGAVRPPAVQAHPRTAQLIGS